MKKRQDQSIPRIAFSGASGTGKTVLAQYVAEKLGIPLNPVGARSVAAEMGFFKEDGRSNPYGVDKADLRTYVDHTTGEVADVAYAARLATEAYSVSPTTDRPTCRKLFQQKLLTAKIAWENENYYTGFVTDRSTADNLAYDILHNARGLELVNIKDAMEHATRYTYTFVTPAQAFISIASDPARAQELPYHRAYELVLEGILLSAFSEYDADYTFSVWHVHQSNLEGRKKYLDRFLESILWSRKNG